ALNGRLSLQKPVHGLIKIVDIGVASAKFLRQSCAVPAAGCGQLGTGEEDTGGNHGDDQLALVRRFGAEGEVEIQLANGSEDRFDMPVGSDRLTRKRSLTQAKSSPCRPR